MPEWMRHPPATPVLREIQVLATPRVTTVVSASVARIARTACAAELCALVVIACGSEGSNRTVPVETRGIGGTNAGVTGGVSIGGVASGGASGAGTSGSAGNGTDGSTVSYGNLCPTFKVPVCTFTVSNMTCYASAWIEAWVYGCCLPTGQCGGSWTLPASNCEPYGSFIPPSWFYPPPYTLPAYGSCMYPSHGAGADASTSTDANAPNDSGPTRDSSASSDSAADGPG